MSDAMVIFLWCVIVTSVLVTILIVPGWLRYRRSKRFESGLADAITTAMDASTRTPIGASDELDAWLGLPKRRIVIDEATMADVQDRLRRPRPPVPPLQRLFRK